MVAAKDRQRASTGEGTVKAMLTRIHGYFLDSRHGTQVWYAHLAPPDEVELFDTHSQPVVLSSLVLLILCLV